MLEFIRKFGILVKCMVVAACFCRISLVLGTWNPLSWPHSRVGPLTIIQAEQSYGVLSINQGMGGEQLTVNAVIYRSGIATHAHSKIETIVEGSDQRLVGSCIYPSFAGGARIRCQVYDGDRLMHQTPELDSDHRIANFTIVVPQSRKITLVAESLNIRVDGAHAAWVNLETIK